MMVEEIRKIAQENFEKKLTIALNHHLSRINDGIKKSAHNGKMKYHYPLIRNVFVEHFYREALVKDIITYYEERGFATDFDTVNNIIIFTW